MDLSIKGKDVKNYELTKVEVKPSKDGKVRYAVCEFRQAGLRKVLQEQTRPVVMQLMAAYGSTKEHEDVYFKLLEETVGEVMPICCVEVAGFPDFVRKDNDDKIITETKERDGKQVKVASVYNSVFIYTLCTDEGECIKSDASLIKRVRTCSITPNVLLLWRSTRCNERRLRQLKKQLRQLRRRSLIRCWRYSWLLRSANV